MLDISFQITSFISLFFLLSGLAKYFSIKNFERTINKIGFKGTAAKIISLLVPFLEILLSIGLLITQTHKLFAILIIGTLTVFLLVSIRIIKMKNNIRCNCFGSLSKEEFGGGTLIRIGLLILISISLLLMEYNPVSTIYEGIIPFQVSIELILIYLYFSTIFENINEQKRKLKR